MRVYRALVALAFVFLAPSPDAQSVFTVAGGADLEGRPATSFPLTTLHDVAVDSSGNIYISDGDSFRVRMVSAETGLISTIAGNGTKGSAGDGGPATAAAITPLGIDVDVHGNVFIIDGEFFNESVRRVDALTGIITTVAGGGASIDDGIPAIEFAFNTPEDLVVASNGDLYVADQEGVHRIDVAGGTIHLIAGGGDNSPGDGGPATAAQMYYTRDVAIDERSGSLFIADFWNRRVRRVDLFTGVITTVAGGGSESGDGLPATSVSLSVPDGVTVDESGDVYVADSQTNRVWRIESSSGLIRSFAGTGIGGFSGDGNPATIAHLKSPNGLSVDSSGDLYISDSSNGRVRKVDTAGTITTVAGAGLGTGFQNVGDGGPGTAATLFTSSTGSLFAFNGLALDSSGTLYISDTDNHRIRRLDGRSGVITTVAGNGLAGSPRVGSVATDSAIGSPGGLAVDPQGNLLFGDNDEVFRIDATSGTLSKVAGGGSGGDGEPATAAQLSGLAGITVDTAGNVLVAEESANRVRRIDATSGVISTIAGSGATGPSGDIGDGGPATLAILSNPTGLTIDGNGDLLIADRYHNVLRKVTMSTGIISTVAGSGWPFYEGDGIPATSTGMGEVLGIGVDAEGNLYLAETSGSRLHRVDAATGFLWTIAGQREELFDYLPVYSGDNGPAIDASLGQPEGIAVSPDGDVYLLDTNSNRVRVIYRCRDVAPPDLTSPADGSSGVSSTTKLEWRPVAGAFRYDVYLDVDSPPATLVAEDIETTSFSTSNLQPLTTYYWKVVAKGDPYCDPYRTAESVSRSLTTASECQVPSVPGP